MKKHIEKHWDWNKKLQSHEGICFIRTDKNFKAFEDEDLGAKTKDLKVTKKFGTPNLSWLIKIFWHKSPKEKNPRNI